MSKFKVGDLVVKKSGEAFSNGENVVTVKETVGEYVFFEETNSHIGQTVLDHYGQTLAELNVKAGDVVEFLSDLVGNSKYTILDNMCLRSDLCVCIDYRSPWDSCNKFRIITRATSQTHWLPCPPDYKPQDNHEVTCHMGVPTHYYVTEPVLVDVEKRVRFDGRDISRLSNHHNATLRGQTRDGKPVGQWTIDMDAD